MKKVNIKLLKGNGDFRSDECREILEKADIVVTNPPFSLIRELFSILKEEKKQYILMGCLLNVQYKKTLKWAKKRQIMKIYFYQKD